MLLNRGMDIVSANCDVYDTYDDKTDKTGKIVLLQIELDFRYPAAEMFKCLPPDWMTTSITQYKIMFQARHIRD